MCSKREVIIFFAGAEAFHTLCHVMLPFFFQLPIQILGFTFTHQLNAIALALNAAITALLLWWAYKSK